MSNCVGTTLLYSKQNRPQPTSDMFINKLVKIIMFCKLSAQTDLGIDSLVPDYIFEILELSFVFEICSVRKSGFFRKTKDNFVSQQAACSSNNVKKNQKHLQRKPFLSPQRPWNSLKRRLAMRGPNLHNSHQIWPRWCLIRGHFAF